jgi:sugar phosphate permease
LIIAAALLALIVLPKKLSVSLVILGCVTALMISVNTLLISLIPLRYAYTGRMTVIIGILNTSAYLGSGIGGYGISSIIVPFGWNVIRSFLCAAAFFAVIACVVLDKRWRKFLGARRKYGGRSWGNGVVL